MLRTRKANRSTLYCFSPPVMIATFVIELSLAAYTLWRYKMNRITRMATVLFVALATFQLAEYMVCRQMGGDPLVWSRVGYVAITVLPPVGLHLLAVIAGNKSKWLIWPGYLAGAAFIVFFSVIGRSIAGHVCLGNYVIFQVAPGSGWLYGLYYYGLLLATLSTGWWYLRRNPHKKVRRAVSGLMLGYSIFIVPATSVNLMNSATVSGMPSIMCGFAVLLAWMVLPVTAERK